ncbi:MAG: PH domain-containing protein [Parcubacteria group bacterium]
MIKEFFTIFRESENSFEGQKEGEKVLLLLRRHIFVILVPLTLFTLGALVPVVVGALFWSYLADNGWRELFLLVSSLWYLGFWLSIFYLLTIYTLNTVIITDRRIIDRDQHDFFNLKVSELHSDRIQDVSIHTNGVIETFLEFGDVTVQTAASERHFVFHQMPQPEKIKDLIMQITSSRHAGVKAAV